MAAGMDRIRDLESEIQWLKEECECLSDTLAELREFVPMLARLAFFEDFAGSVPDNILKVQDHVRYDYDQAKHFFGPEWTRPRGERLPAAAQALRDAYNARTTLVAS